MRLRIFLWVTVLGLLAGCGGATTAGGAQPAGSQAETVQSPAGTTNSVGVTEFLARGGFLGFASISDRAIGQNRFLVYHSRLDLVPEDSNSADDIYLRDLRTGTVSLVSVASDGSQGDGASTQASISSDGRFVVFRSAATNLVADDTNGVEDIFLRDLLAGTTVRVSLGGGGAEANGASSTPAVADGGRFVVFSSTATNLDASDSNGVQDVFLRDTVSNTTTLVSSNSAGTSSANGASYDPAVTPDGAYLAFSTEATDVVAGGLNGQRQVVRIERATPANRVLVSQSAGGAQADGACYEPSLSGDGSRIAFFTLATNLGPAADTNGFFDVYLRDQTANTTTRISQADGGGESDNHSGFASLSENGNAVAYGSLATNLVSNDDNGGFDVFTWSGGTTSRASLTAGEGEANFGSDLPAISQDGHWVAFRSAATNLIGLDALADDDIFVRSCAASTTWSGFGEARNLDIPFFGESDVEAADLDGDGDLDLAVPSENAGEVALLRNDGGFAFTEMGRITTGSAPHAIRAGDLDGDKDPDLVTVNLGGTASILRNDGSFTFTNVGNLTLGDAPWMLSIADLDGDTDLDVAVTNQDSDSVNILRNDGGMSFTNVATITVTGAPRQIEAGDLDGDTDRDLVVAGLMPGGVSILRNDGGLTFTEVDPVSVSLASALTIADFDGDIDLDLGIGRTAGGVTFLRNDGGLTFTAFTSSEVSGSFEATHADIDGDGDADFLVCSSGFEGLHMLRNDGAFSFTDVATLASGSPVYGLVAADLNGDNAPDLAAAAPPKLSFFANSGLVCMGTPTTFWASISCAFPAVWPGMGAAQNFTVGDGPYQTALGDLDGDGDLDLVCSNSDTGDLSIRLGDGSGSFGAITSVPIGVSPRGTSLADLDGDGDLDLLAVNFVDATVSVVLNGGAGTFGAATNLAVGAGPFTVEAADVDGDGDLDIITANDTDNSVSVLLNNGGGVFGTATTLGVGSRPFDVVPADLDGDGDIDLAATNFADSDVSILLNDGTGAFIAVGAFGTGTNPISLTATDVDGDADLDLTIANFTSNNVTVLYNDGSANFASAANFSAGSRPHSITNADLDGDGDQDLAVANLASNTLSVLLNSGGSFTTVGTLATGFSPRSVSAADVDNDGDFDLGVAEFSSNRVSIRLNQACP